MHDNFFPRKKLNDKYFGADHKRNEKVKQMKNSGKSVKITGFVK